MAAIAIRQNTWNGLTALQQGIVKRVLARLDIGTFAPYSNGGVAWLIADDPRIDLLDLAILGTVASRLGSLPDTTNLTPAQIRAAITAWLPGKIVLPANINYTGSSNFYQTTLDANSAPASVKASEAVPAGWIPI